MNRKTLTILIILAVGAVLAVLILQIQPPVVHEHEEPPGHSEAEERGHSEAGETEAEEKAEERGPHRGFLFAEGDLQLEVTIYERNVPPEFRVYATDARGNNIPLDQIQMSIDLHRLERVDSIRFHPSGEYLLGDRVVAEPHSFVMKITAKWNGKTYRWTREQIEFRAEISREQADNAGIQVARAGPRGIKDIVTLDGEIGLHEKRVAHIVPRVDSLVVEVNKDMGDSVKVGDLLAVLQSRELADAKSTYLTAVKQAEPVRVELNRQKLINKNTRIMLDLLQQGLDLDALYEKINKLVLGESRAQIIPAYATLIRSKAVYEREQSLYEKKISSRSEYLLAMEEYKSAEARYIALREKIAYNNQLALLEKQKALEKANLEIKTQKQKLQALGLTARQIKNLSHEQKARLTHYELRSEINGTIIEKHIVVGEAIQKNASVFVVADLSEVWVNIAIPARDMGLVQLGQEIRVREESQRFQAVGKLFFLGSVLDNKTRTVTGRIIIPNSDRRWRPGMYVKIDLIRDTKTVPVAVPVKAVQKFRDWDVVFLRVGTQYEPRPVTLGHSDGQWVEITEGLRPGDTYVQENSFTIKAELQKSAATHSH